MSISPFDDIEGKTVDEQVAAVAEVNGHFNMLIAVEDEFHAEAERYVETPYGDWCNSIAIELADLIRRRPLRIES